MSSTFTPSSAVDPSKERDWSAQLGMLDWDNTNIVFTKRTLLEFLKYAGVTVDTNFTNIQKLPRYAKFGKMTAGGVASTEEAATSDAATEPSAAEATDSDFKPTRRVREPPGGAHSRIFGYDEDDALAGAPSTNGESATITPSASLESQPEPELSGWDAHREAVAAKSNPQAGFKPTRRVREMPGGKDSISSLF